MSRLRRVVALALAGGCAIVCCMSAIQGAQHHRETVQLNLRAKLLSAERRRGQVDLTCELVNVGENPVRVSLLLLPWQRAQGANFVVCRDGTPLERSPRLLLPIDDPRTTEQVLERGESLSGGLAFTDLQPGHYDVVGLLFCEAAAAPGGRFERVPLPLGHLAFDVREKQGE